MRGDPLDLAVDPVAGREPQHLLQHDPALEPGERRAEAVVDALAKREVALDFTRDVQLAGALPPALVAVGGPPQQHDRAADGDRLAVQLELGGRATDLVLDGRLEAQQLLDGRPDPVRLGGRCARWTGCSASSASALPTKSATVSVPATYSRMQ